MTLIMPDTPHDPTPPAPKEVGKKVHVSSQDEWTSLMDVLTQQGFQWPGPHVADLKPYLYLHNKIMRWGDCPDFFRERKYEEVQVRDLVGYRAPEKSDQEEGVVHDYHVHHAEMAQYAKTAAVSRQPWVRWEFKVRGQEWTACRDHPGWCETTEYRRKPLEVGEEMSPGHTVTAVSKDNYVVKDVFGTERLVPIGGGHDE